MGLSSLTCHLEQSTVKWPPVTYRIVKVLSIITSNVVLGLTCTLLKGLTFTNKSLHFYNKSLATGFSLCKNLLVSNVLTIVHYQKQKIYIGISYMHHSIYVYFLRETNFKVLKVQVFQRNKLEQNPQTSHSNL